MRANSKEDQIHILQYQKDIRDRVKHYRSMELDILEKMEKDREEREARVATIRGNLGSKMGLIRKHAKNKFCELEFKNQ